MQNQTTGADAAKFGHTAAAIIGLQIGAKKLSSKSNEFDLSGNRISLHSARLGNKQVGVLYNTLDRIHSVIGAFEITPNEFELFSLRPETFKAEMRDSPTGNGRVGLVKKNVFQEKGTFVARIILPADNP